MKRFFLLLLTVIILHTVHAEYGAFYTTFKITTIQGEEQIAYAFVIESYFEQDSMESTSYLKYALDHRYMEWSMRDSLIFYKNRIKYDYVPVYDSSGSTDSIYYHCNRSGVPLNQIAKLEILEMIRHSYIRGISSSHTCSDSTWMQHAPVRQIAIEGYFCYHMIYIHQSSPVIEEVIQKIKAKKNEIDAIDFETNEYGNSLEAEQEKLDKLDEEVQQILNGLDGEKVVIISDCSC